MKLPWKRSRSRMLVVGAVALGALILALPLMPSLRRYVRMASM